jgi:hypothetical protein
MAPVLAVLLFALVSYPQAGGGGKEPSAESKKALEVFKTVEQLAAALGDDVWPGYDARKYTFTRREKSGETSVCFAPDPGKPEPQVFMILSGDYFLKHTLEENLTIAFHEAFHAFQRDAARPGAKWRAEPALLVFDYAAVPARNNALFAIEARILFDALDARDDERVRMKAREFLAVRKLRQAELDQRLVEFETGAESNEGLAEYAGTRAVTAGMAAAGKKRVEVPFINLDAATYLREKYANLKSVTRLGRNDRLRFYYTGSAQGFLLDRLLPGWKVRVQEKATPVQDLLAEATGGAADKATADAALKEYGYERVAKEEEAAAAKRREEGEKLFESVRGEKGRRYTLDVSALGRMGDYLQFDPMNVVVLDRGRRVHTRMANFGQEGVYRVEFTQPVVEDREKKEYFTVVEEGDKQSAVLDGDPLPLDKPVRKRIKTKLVIETPHFRLEAGPGEVAVTEAGVVVTAEKKPK